MTTERVTFRQENKRTRTIYLQDAEVRQAGKLGEVLTGIEVNREGDEIAGKGFDERRHIIAMGAVVRRVPVVMDKTYGEFVEA